MTKIYQGSCLCEGIRYEIHGELGDIIQCHCQRCRKASGSAYATNAVIAAADFKLIQGQFLLKKYQSTPITQRFFCMECGSPIYSLKQDMPEIYRLRIGTLDTPITQKPTMHIFTAHKAEWDDIDDALPQYANRPE
ncbi:GFA family protein [Acinetobacter sp. MD2(2019)]|uniref:GFA family protein n=1 Tax=Acinetobacter sp. MD2(2019) TaxID=2605273 RepID=UPI002D1EC9B2|nr:GFA family protein [Acinetobacter sp. MD2(2019)]MEB3753561.1 GFA family protein [Acinetobacter sp. MD2(2019)]